MQDTLLAKSSLFRGQLEATYYSHYRDSNSFNLYWRTYGWFFFLILEHR